MKLSRVERIVDGDSVWVFLELEFGIYVRKEIRLLKVDAPEKNSKAGKLVKTFVEQWFFKNDKFVTLTIDDSPDKFGRVLGTFFDKDGFSLNNLLIESELVKKFDGTGKRSWLQEELDIIESKAKLILEQDIIKSLTSKKDTSDLDKSTAPLTLTIAAQNLGKAS